MSNSIIINLLKFLSDVNFDLNEKIISNTKKLNILKDSILNLFIENFIYYTETKVSVEERSSSINGNTITILLNIKDFGTHVLNFQINKLGINLTGISLSASNPNNVFNVDLISSISNFLNDFNKTQNSLEFFNIFDENKIFIENYQLNQIKIDNLNKLIVTLNLLEKYNISIFEPFNVEEVFASREVRVNVFGIKNKHLDLRASKAINFKLQSIYRNVIEILNGTSKIN